MATAPEYSTATTEPWYHLSTQETMRRLDTRREGITNEGAENRLQEYGPNELKRKKGPSRLIIFLRQFESPLVYVLFIAGIITALVGNYEDTVVILIIVFVNAIIGYVQETKAAAALEALIKMTSPTATLVRNGVATEVEIWQVVPGDIVLLNAGDKVPADIRLLEAHSLAADEAPLTGESVPVAKTTAPIRERNLTPADQINMVFAGTTITSGRGVGIVVVTGQHTELGKISEQVTGVEVTETPLQARLHKFSKFLGLVVLGLVVLVFALGILVGYELLEMFLIAVTLAVSAIPEGLPATVTIILSIGTRRMAQRNAIIRKLPAVETLGTADFICTDKTGTLTRNEMTVRAVYADNRCYEVTGAGYEPQGELTLESRDVDLEGNPTLKMLIIVGVLANDAQMARQDNTRKVLGDPTEGVLLVLAEKAGLDPQIVRQRHERLAEIPFESEYQYMATLNRMDGEIAILLKGAPGQVVEMCTSQMRDTGRGPIERQIILDEAGRLADQGFRVLGLAYKPTDKRELTRAEAEQGLTFVGLVGIIDPPRPEAAEAVDGAYRAGVRVAMITGDHKQTAMAIARQLGILRRDQRVLTGSQLERLSDGELDRVIDDVAVYARAAPEHKLRIVERLRTHDHIVAVTGDGVNDAPALRAADIGIAMGITGTDVSKETADMVLADDNFASIFAAIGEGRVVFENIRKAIFFLLSTNAGEVLTILVALLIGLPLPLVPVQILWMNLVTDSAPVIALGFEPGEREFLERPPRNPKSEMLSKVLQYRILLVSILMAIGTLGLFAYELGQGTDLARSRSVAFTTLVLFQFFNALNARSENQSIFTRGLASNPYVLGGIAIGVALQMAVLYIPAVVPLLQTAPLTVENWALALLVSSTALWAIEIEKLVRRRSGMIDRPTER